MTKLIFYGGIATIGGNCVVLEDEKYRIMLDNGMCFSTEENYFKTFLDARGGNDTRDFVSLELIPAINGIYGKDVLTDVGFDLIEKEGQYLLKTDLDSYESYIKKSKTPFIEAIFISHAHIDHFRNLFFMHPNIPVYCSQITYELLKITSELSITDYLNYYYAELGNYGGGAYFPGAIKKEKQSIKRKFIIMEPYKPYKIKNFTVTGYPIDHSLVGGMAFQIKTKDGKQIVYTGDIRFHGLKRERENSNHFVEEISNTATDALICEGTKIDSEKEIGEDDVFQVTLDHIKEDKEYKKKLIFVSFPWKNISRFLTVYRIAKELKRTIAIQSKTAYLLHNLGKNETLEIKDILHNNDIRIYFPRKRSMLYSKGDYINSKHCISYDLNWEKKDGYKVNLYEDLYGDKILIKAYEINNHPEKYIVHLQFYDIIELLDIRPPENSFYFIMKTEPYDEEGEIEKKITENWINRHKLNSISIHASGHAPGNDLLKLIKKINPEIIFPIHTEHPELFKMKKAIKDIVFGKPYEI
ncbi:MAG: MBL fold metallo-hydrolase RNA specificity domain-containing protein [Promethearchaeota archaeon]